MKKFQQIIKENFIRGDEERIILTETKLSRIIGYHFDNGFIIVSAFRKDRVVDDEGKTIKDKNDKVNKQLHQQLKKDVTSAGYPYIPVYGGYIENKGLPDEQIVEEDSLLIPNRKVDTGKEKENDDLKELGMKLAKKYNQESFFYKPKGKDDVSYYITPEGKEDMKFTGKTLNDLEQIYFTRLNKGKTDRRFTMLEFSINGSPKSTSEAATRYGELFYSEDV